MSERPIAFVDPGRFELYCHHSLPTFYPEESHQTIQVCVPLESARYDVSRQSETGTALVHTLGARDVLVLPAGQPHAVTWKRPADIVSLQMSESFIREALGVSCLRLQDAFTIRDSFISAVGLQIRSAVRSDAGISAAFADAMATAIAYRIGVGASTEFRIRAAQTVSELSAYQRRRVRRFIDERLDQPIRLAELAGHIGMTKWHFTRRFNASCGMSPHDYITNCRMERARDLLSTSDAPIVAVALEVGMSHSHFSRTFLGRVGVSPSEYRQLRKTAISA
jgi:AraC family transcriptional regulator